MNAFIDIKVVTNAHINEVAGRMADGKIKIRLNEKPISGKANQALINFISEKLNIPKGAILITSGEKSRIKRIRIDALSKEDIEKILLA